VFPGDDEPGIRRSLQRALDLAARRGPGARIWIIRSHVGYEEAVAWRRVLARYRVVLVTSGVEPVAVLTP
jgi:hypothetical protein